MQKLSTLPRLALHRSASLGSRKASVGVCPRSSRDCHTLRSLAEAARKRPEYWKSPLWGSDLSLERSQAITAIAYIGASIRLCRILCKEWPRKGRIACCYAAEAICSGLIMPMVPAGVPPTQRLETGGGMAASAPARIRC